MLDGARLCDVGVAETRVQVWVVEDAAQTAGPRTVAPEMPACQLWAGGSPTTGLVLSFSCSGSRC